MLCARIATWPGAPIVVVSAEHAEERIIDALDALDAGARDYLTKPFRTAELLARLRVAMRLDGTADVDAGHRVLAAGDVVLESSSGRIAVGASSSSWRRRPPRCSRVWSTAPAGW